MPDTPASLWLLANDVNAPGQGAPVPNWPDRSGFANNATPINPTAPVLLSNLSPFGLAPYFQLNTGSQLLNPVRLGGDFAVFAVVNFQLSGSTDGPVYLLCPDPGLSGQGWLLGATAISVATDAGLPAKWTIAAGNALTLLSIRRVTGVCHLKLNGSEVSPLGKTLRGTLGIADVGVITNLLFGPEGCQLVELRVYDGPITDADFAAVETALRNTYGL